MSKVLVFAGTTEGYSVSRFLSENQIPVCACVATDYGSKSLEENAYLTVQAKRMNQEEMEAFFETEKPILVLDATHPYAAEVTVNIKKACEHTGTGYRRVLRENGVHGDRAVYVSDIEEAVAFLNRTRGNILVTTGSKELKSFTALADYQNRLYCRVLSLPSVMETCSSYGLEGKHLIGMQGPFSKELNTAMLRQFSCRYLVTKDTGKAGGFMEKLEAAMECDAVPVIIGRPLKEEGMTLLECKKYLIGKFGIHRKPHVTLLGIGMGSEDTLTMQGKRAAEEAELIIGARRIADAVKGPGQTVIYEYRAEQIAQYISRHPEYENVLVALSGDVGFYSGAKKLMDYLGKDTQVICGISSVVYFMAKAGLSWDDAKIVSAHGRDCNLIPLICQYEKVFAILGTKTGVQMLAQKLVRYDMGEILLYVGENLSYETETVFCRPAKELVDYQGDALSVVCAWNPGAVPLSAVHGIRDEEFLRGKAPMTKEEVRTVSLSKLGLNETSVCYDVGAGTGSVSVEMALRAHQGRVYAIEKKEEALTLLKENKRRFAADNLEIISGTAPAAMEELPAPTHVFIGGSSGNLHQILELVLKKNPDVRIVMNCITLETVGEALEALKKYDFQESEIVQMNLSRSKSVGRYHMMMGENPIYIITCEKGALPQ